MKENRKVFGKLCLLSIIIALSLLTIVGSSYMSVYALKKYEYKKGDEYRFVTEMSTTVNTEEGKTTASQSYEIIIKIKDVDEDVDGYSTKIDVLMVGSTGYYPGFYGYDGLMRETTIEGDSLFGDMGGFFNLFTSTDWDDREDEWKDFVDSIDDQPGYRITDDSASNGVFTLRAEMDVDDDESWIDYDGDDDYDGYTGWESLKGDYDNKGVLKSSSYETYMEFNERNSVKYSYKVYRGALPVALREILIYIAIGVVCSVVAFILGFFVGKRRMPKATGISAAKPVTTEP